MMMNSSNIFSKTNYYALVNTGLPPVPIRFLLNTKGLTTINRKITHIALEVDYDQIHTDYFRQELQAGLNELYKESTKMDGYILAKMGAGHFLGSMGIKLTGDLNNDMDNIETLMKDKIAKIKSDAEGNVTKEGGSDQNYLTALIEGKDTVRLELTLKRADYSSVTPEFVAEFNKTSATKWELLEDGPMKTKALKHLRLTQPGVRSVVVTDSPNIKATRSYQEEKVFGPLTKEEYLKDKYSARLALREEEFQNTEEEFTRRLKQEEAERNKSEERRKQLRHEIEELHPVIYEAELAKDYYGQVELYKLADKLNEKYEYETLIEKQREENKKFILECLERARIDKKLSDVKMLEELWIEDRRTLKAQKTALRIRIRKESRNEKRLLKKMIKATNKANKKLARIERQRKMIEEKEVVITPESKEKIRTEMETITEILYIDPKPEKLSKWELINGWVKAGDIGPMTYGQYKGETRNYAYELAELIKAVEELREPELVYELNPEIKIDEPKDKSELRNKGIENIISDVYNKASKYCAIQHILTGAGVDMSQYQEVWKGVQEEFDPRESYEWFLRYMKLEWLLKETEEKLASIDKTISHKETEAVWPEYKSNSINTREIQQDRPRGDLTVILKEEEESKKVMIKNEKTRLLKYIDKINNKKTITDEDMDKAYKHVNNQMRNMENNIKAMEKSYKAIKKGLRLTLPKGMINLDNFIVWMYIIACMVEGRSFNISDYTLVEKLMKETKSTINKDPILNRIGNNWEEIMSALIGIIVDKLIASNEVVYASLIVDIGRTAFVIVGATAENNKILGKVGAEILEKLEEEGIIDIYIERQGTKTVRMVKSGPEFIEAVAYTVRNKRSILPQTEAPRAPQHVITSSSHNVTPIPQNIREILQKDCNQEWTIDKNMWTVLNPRHPTKPLKPIMPLGTWDPKTPEELHRARMAIIDLWIPYKESIKEYNKEVLNRMAFIQAGLPVLYGLNFHFQLSLDFRGRLYRLGNLAPENGDIQRALLSTPNRYDVNTSVRTVMWSIAEKMKIDINKLREDIETGKSIRECFKRAPGGRKELVAQRIILELYNSRKEGYKSGYLVSQDMSNSAYQIISGLTGDKYMAHATNLHPNIDGIRQDLYTDIAETLKQISVEYKDVNRKHIKRVVMAIPYGMGDRTAIESLCEEMKDEGTVHINKRELLNNIKKIINIKYPNLYDIMNEVKEQIRTKGDTVFKMEDGFILDIGVWQTNIKRMTIDGDRVNINEKGKEMDWEKTVRGAFVNIVHAHDAAIARKVIDKVGCPLLTVHDCYMSAIPDMDNVHLTVRLATREVLKNSKILKSIGIEKNSTFEYNKIIKAQYLLSID